MDLHTISAHLPYSGVLGGTVTAFRPYVTCVTQLDSAHNEFEMFVTVNTEDRSWTYHDRGPALNSAHVAELMRYHLEDKHAELISAQAEESEQ